MARPAEKRGREGVRRRGLGGGLGAAKKGGQGSWAWKLTCAIALVFGSWRGPVERKRRKGVCKAKISYICIFSVWSIFGRAALALSLCCVPALPLQPAAMLRGMRNLRPRQFSTSPYDAPKRLASDSMTKLQQTLDRFSYGCESARSCAPFAGTSCAVGAGLAGRGAEEGGGAVAGPTHKSSLVLPTNLTSLLHTHAHTPGRPYGGHVSRHDADH